MKRYHLPTYLFALLCAAATWGHAGALRVAVAPTPQLRDPALGTVLWAVAGLYLQERLAECTGVHLVTPQRSASIFRKLTDGAEALTDADRFNAFVAHLPVDVTLQSLAVEEGFKVMVSRADAVLELTADGPPQEALLEIGGRLAEWLQLDAADQHILTEARWPNDDSLVRGYVARVWRARGRLSTGGHRLEVLSPVWSQIPHPPAVAAEVLHATSLVAGEGRRPPDLPKAIIMARRSLPYVLGTPHEATAAELLEALPETFAEEVLEIAQPVIEFSRSDGLTFDFDDMGDDDEIGIVVKDPGGPPLTEAQRLGAVRLLGQIDSAAARDALILVATHETTAAREAAAVGLGHASGDATLAALQTLARDREARVGFLAAYALWQRKSPPDTLLDQARAATSWPDLRAHAAEVLEQRATAQDRALLESLANDRLPGVRADTCRAQLRLGLLSAKEITLRLQDVDDTIVTMALAHLPSLDESAEADAITRRLCDDPLESLALAARQALAPRRPTEKLAQLSFDLETASPYTRLRAVDALAAMGEPEARQLLLSACHNRNAYCRAHALMRLAETRPEAAADAAALGIGDAHPWTRLHAASIIADRARPEHVLALQTALAAEQDAAIRLYLEAALARSEGRPEPPRGAPARSVRSQDRMTWNCGHGLDAPHSPFTGYYEFGTVTDPVWREAYRRGKIFFGRISVVGHPGSVMLSRSAREHFWQNIDAALLPEDLPFIDGVVFGEETMSMPPDGLWAAGWRAFCLDAGLDPDRVEGNLESLSETEHRAWVHWAMARSVEGFNMLYDYVKLKYARLRPGLQVCTFLPDQGLMNTPVPPNVRDWRFDVGGVYDYKGDNRMAAYTLVRRYRTLWPERPVLWLSLGIGGYEMNPVRRTLKPPAAPLLMRNNRSYADSATAWLAGADPGWFSTWIFVEKDAKTTMAGLCGVQINVEDIAPKSPLLAKGIALAFKGIRDEIELRDMKMPELAADANVMTEETDVEDAFFDVEDLLGDTAEQREETVARDIADAKERLRRGFLFYQQYVYDCVRIFASLARQTPRPLALTVRPGVTTWTRPTTRNPLTPGFALLNAYDFLCDINQCPELDLAHYRLIMVRDPGLLRDETIAALTHWLKTSPGVLYVSRNLTADNGDEASTPGDLDGHLARDWPWEADVTMTPMLTPPRPSPQPMSLSGNDSALEIAGAVQSARVECHTNARAVWREGDDGVLAVWQAPGFRGAVVFDGIESATADYIEAVRDVLNGLSENGIGLALTGPRLHVTGQCDGVSVSAATRYYREAMPKSVVEGRDALSGETNPVVGTGYAAVCPEDYSDRFLASGNGITALSDQAFTAAEKQTEGMLLATPGLARVAGQSGVTITRVDGTSLPEPDAPLTWLLFEKSEGLITLPENDTAGNCTLWFRCATPVVVSGARPTT